LNPRWFLVLIVVAYALSMGRTVGYGFVWDDVSTIAEGRFFDRPLSQVLRTTEHVRMDESIAAMRGVGPGHESYRPVNVATHWIDVALFGRRPAPMHVHTLLWGTLGILLAYALAARLLGGREEAAVVATVFAFHPVHIEPFAYISARADLVGGTFALLAALCLVLSSQRTGELPVRTKYWWVGAACLAYLGALFAKEAAIVLPLAMLGLALALGKTRDWAVGLVALAATAAVHFPLRALLVPGPLMARPAGLGLVFLRTPGVVLQYLRSFIAPVDISIARPLDPWLVPVGWFALLLAMGSAAVLVHRHRSGLSERHDTSGAGACTADAGLALAGLLWIALFVAPAGVAMATLGALADRYAYLPLFGFGLMVAIALRRVLAMRHRPRVRGGLLVALAVWGVMLAVVSQREIPFWRSNVDLYAHALAVEPESAIAHYRMGVVWSSAGQWERAAGAFARADALKQGSTADMAPALDRVLNNLAVAYINLGRTVEAEQILRRAIRQSDNVSFRAWYNLAVILRDRGDAAGACAALAESLAISPRYERARADHAIHCPRSLGRGR
jgi:Flp pilus assembly protein TadD